MMTEKKPLAVYLHIPFCIRKCLYCDFLSGPATQQERARYVTCLAEEIRQEAARYRDYQVETVFLGGGTPSLLTGGQLQLLLQTLRENYALSPEAEISMEVNPGTVSEGQLSLLRSLGVNRLSIGMQSARDEELRLLGRIHTAREGLAACRQAAAAGFTNINVDLMTSIPGQTKESYCSTLQQVLSLTPAPTHISAYSLIVEEGTPFFEQPPVLPDEDTDRQLYHMTGEILQKEGYHRYEISNYAREGYECRHNKVYWQRGEYVGFGIGAASLICHERFSNIRDREEYCRRIERHMRAETEQWESEPLPELKEERQILSVEEEMGEFMFLGLRMTCGVSRQEFFRTFGRKWEDVYPGVVEKWKMQGLLQERTDLRTGEERLSLTDFGLDVSNVVMADFI